MNNTLRFSEPVFRGGPKFCSHFSTKGESECSAVVDELRCLDVSSWFQNGWSLKLQSESKTFFSSFEFSFVGSEEEVFIVTV